MATSNQQESTMCENDANFAVITSYILHFGPLLAIHSSIEHLKQMLEDNDHICEELIELHIRLLRKRRKYINKEKWEKALVKFIAEYSNVEAWELERYGYKRVKLAIRLNALKHLLEAQFDYNHKFKGEVNAMESSSLRILPIGRDVRGHQYWFQSDYDLNFRIYKEEPDDEKSWVMICKDKEDLCKLIANLEAGNTHNFKEESSTTVSENDDSNLTVAKELPCKEAVQLKCESTSESNSSDSLKIRLKTENESESSVVNEAKHIKVNGDLFRSEECIRTDCKIKTESEEIRIPCETEECSKSAEQQLICLKVETKIKDYAELSVPLVSPGVCNNFNYNDVVSLMNDLLDKVDVITESSDIKCHSDNIDVIVKEVCNYLLDSVCNNERCTKETPIDEIVRACRGGRSRGRPRGRGGSRSRGRGGGRIAKPVDNIENIEDIIERDASPVPVKRSLRIQALQEKKNAELAEQMKKEQQRLEELAKKRSEQKKLNTESKNRKAEKVINETKDNSDSEYSSESESESDEGDCKTRKRKKKRRRKRHRGYPWDTESSATSESSEESEVEEEEEEVLKFDENEDEFACEDPEPDAEPIVLKRARTVKKIRSDSESDEEESDEENDDTPCRRCGKYDHPEWILLCDTCDSGYHTACLNPPLMIIPDGDWFCPPCENKSLREKLQEEYSNLLKQWEKKEREELRKQRLKFVAINVDNILKPKFQNQRKHSTDSQENEKLPQNESKEEIKSESEGVESEDDNDSEEDYLKLRSVRTCKRINYQFTEYDELINSAIRDDNYEDDGYVYEKHPLAEVEVKENNLLTLKAEGDEPIANVVVEEHEVDVKIDVSEAEPQEIIPVVPKGFNTKKNITRKKRLNDLDTPSEDDDSDESFKGSSETEVEDITEDDEYADSVTEEEDEEESDEFDYKSRRRSGGRSSSSRSRKVTRKAGSSKKGGRRGYRRDGFVVDSDDSDLDTAGHSRIRTRAAARKKVSYKEVSSDETEEEQSWCWKSSKSSKRKDSESSDDDWGSRNKKNKRDKGWSCVVRDDEEEEDEEEDDEEEEDEEASDDSDVKPASKKVEMRGKPRLSKARLMNLREESEDDVKRKRAKIEEEEDNESGEEEEEEEKPAESNESTIEIPTNSVSDEVKENENNNATNVALVPVESTANEITEDETQKTVMVTATTSLPNQASTLSEVHASMATTSQQQSEPSALSQLTAFASRGPITSAPSPMSQPSAPFNTFSPSHPPPPLVHTSDKDDNDGYSITPLDNYSTRQKPLKPALISDSYPPQTLSPSRLLNLESGNYPQPGSPSRLMNLERFHPPPHQMNNFDKRGPPPPMSPLGNRLHSPFPSPAPRDFSRRQTYNAPGAPPDFVPQSRHFYEPPPGFPRHQLPPNMHPTGTSQPTMPFRHPAGSPAYHPSSSPVGYFPQTHHQASRFYPPASHVGQTTDRSVTLPSTSSSVYSSPYPPQVVSSNHHYAAYYAHSGGLTPNGGFMIQNLLQQRANASSTGTGNSNETTSVEEDELRSVTDIVSFITQE